jgi:hypothetical protein
VRRVPASREPDRLADAAKPLPPFLGLAKTRGQITPVGRRCRFFPSVGKDGTAKILLNQSLEPIKLADGQPAERLDELSVRAEALLDGAGCGSVSESPRSSNHEGYASPLVSSTPGRANENAAVRQGVADSGLVITTRARRSGCSMGTIRRHLTTLAGRPVRVVSGPREGHQMTGCGRAS